MAAIKLISHASVIVDVAGVRVLSDPWTAGKAFNASWSLLVEPCPLAEDLPSIDYIWISHEHPDHFHLPSLRALPEDFRKRVTVLFQDNHSEKMVKALKGMLGFGAVKVLPHRKFVELKNGVKAYCFHSRQIDSTLALVGDGYTILNLNDCEMSTRDLTDLKSDLGAVDVVLNQFSVAGFGGTEQDLAATSRAIISNYVRDSVALTAKYTIPFASFIYFCCSDNKFINRHANTPRQVTDALARAGSASVVLKPGDFWEVGAPWDNSKSR